MKYFLFFIYLIFIHTSFLYSQKPLFHGTFDYFSDNREYFSDYGFDQTIFGARLDLKAEFSIDTSQRVFIGFNYLYEFGHMIDGHMPQLDLYYLYKEKSLTLLFGSFPRKGYLNYPNVLMSDTFIYYRPNIEGSLNQISGKWGFQNVWIDWTGRQTKTNRETFLAGISGRINYRSLYFENYLYMYHRAKVINPPSDDHIRDNGGLAVFLGVDLKSKIPLDKINADIGFVNSYDRFRPDPVKYPKGFMIRFKTLYKIVGINGSVYKGDKQILVNGEHLYSSGNYSRFDLVVVPFKANRVKAEFLLGFHILPDQTDWSQQMFVTVDFLK